MIKAITRTLFILVLAIAIGLGTYWIIQNLSQSALAVGEFRDGGRRPGNDQGLQPGANFPQGFREGGEEGFRGRGAFGLIVGFVSMAGHILLFAVMTLIVVGIGRLIPKKTANPTQNET